MVHCQCTIGKERSTGIKQTPSNGNLTVWPSIHNLFCSVIIWNSCTNQVNLWISLNVFSYHKPNSVTKYKNWWKSFDISYALNFLTFNLESIKCHHLNVTGGSNAWKSRRPYSKRSCISIVPYLATLWLLFFQSQKFSSPDKKVFCALWNWICWNAAPSSKCQVVWEKVGKYTPTYAHWIHFLNPFLNRRPLLKEFLFNATLRSCCLCAHRNKSDMLLANPKCVSNHI